MEDTVINTETGNQQPLETDAKVHTTEQVNVSTTDAELAKKEAEKARMEANMLRNKLAEIEKAEASRRAKELEEQNEYKTLYEQEKAERERLIFEREESERNAQLHTEQSNVLSAFPEEVREIAIDAGITLTDTSEEAVSALKAKLTKIAEKIGTTAKVTPNNNRSENRNASREELIAQYKKTGDPQALEAAVNELSFIKNFNSQQ
jgi:multidrug efflux pump subunit AcrA (membrane-fusion protein)